LPSIYPSSILSYLFCFSCPRAPPDLHSFPTRRSSDLQLRDIQANRAHRRLEQPRLRAKVAVFWAATGLDGDDSFDLHCRPTPLQTRLVRNIRQFFQLRVIAVENLDELFFV